jgi:hypothetical protein
MDEYGCKCFVRLRLRVSPMVRTLVDKMDYLFKVRM